MTVTDLTLRATTSSGELSGAYSFPRQDRNS